MMALASNELLKVYVTRLKTSMTRKGQDFDDLKARKGLNIDDPV